MSSDTPELNKILGPLFTVDAAPFSADASTVLDTTFTMEVGIRGSTLNPAGGYIRRFESGPPDAALGNNNDLYMDTDNLNIYQKISTTWTFIGNPSTSSTTLLTEITQRIYALRSDFVANIAANSSLVDGKIVVAAGLIYKRKTASTAISDLPGFVPVGIIYPEHFGAIGGVTRSNLAWDYSTCTPPDETMLLQAAMDYAVLVGGHMEGTPDRVYGVTGPTYFGKRFVGDNVYGTPELHNLALKCVGGTWTGGTRPDVDNPAGWTWGTPMLSIGVLANAPANEKARMHISGIDVDGAQLAPGGIYFKALSNGDVRDCNAVRCTDFQMRIGDLTNNNTSCTDTVFDGLVGAEWPYTPLSGTGYTDYTLRTAMGLVLLSHDIKVRNCTFSCSKICLLQDGPYNLTMEGNSFWSGVGRNDVNNVTCWIARTAGGYQHVGTRTDDGGFVIDMFSGMLIGCKFNQFPLGNQLTLRASVVGETAQRFSLTGCSFTSSTDAVVTTVGPGTWGTFSAKITGNTGGTNNTFAVNEIEHMISYLNYSTQTELVRYGEGGGITLNVYVDPYTTIRSSKGLLLQTDYDLTGAGARSIDFKIGDKTAYRISEGTGDTYGYMYVGYGQMSGGGSAALEYWDGITNSWYFAPSNLAGNGTDTARKFSYTPANVTWKFDAGLRVVSTEAGMGMPVMTTVQRDAMVSQFEGLMVYNSTTDTLNVYSNGVWVQVVQTTGAQTIGGTKTFSVPIVQTGQSTVPVSPADGSLWFDSHLQTDRLKVAGLTRDILADCIVSGAAYWRPYAGATSIINVGLPAPTAVGTATAATVATTNKFTMTPRAENLVTIAAVNAVSGFRGQNTFVTVGGASAGLGGFRYTLIWGPATGVATTTTRALAGLSNTITAPTDVEPSTSAVDAIFMGWDATDTNVQVMHNNGAGVCTKIDLGASFPRPTVDRTSVYKLELYSPQGTSQSVNYRVTDVVSGDVAQGTISTNMPSTTTLLAPRIWFSVGGTSSVSGTAMMLMHLDPLM